MAVALRCSMIRPESQTPSGSRAVQLAKLAFVVAWISALVRLCYCAFRREITPTDLIVANIAMVSAPMAVVVMWAARWRRAHAMEKWRAASRPKLTLLKTSPSFATQALRHPSRPSLRLVSAVGAKGPARVATARPGVHNSDRPPPGRPSLGGQASRSSRSARRPM